MNQSKHIDSKVRLSDNEFSKNPDNVTNGAAPSVSSAHEKAQARKRLFHCIDYAPRASYFEAQTENNILRGFSRLFWVALTLVVISTCLHNVKNTGSAIRGDVWRQFTPNLRQLALSDAAMVASSVLVLPIHLKVRSATGWLRWKRGGIVIQSLFELAWLAFWSKYVEINFLCVCAADRGRLPFDLKWTWTAHVYFSLHTMIILMKMHSYAFYNGHLSETQRRLLELDQGKSSKDAAAVEQLRETLVMELTSPLGHVTYPQNLTLSNFVDYLLCPTLCYELEYPRTEKIRWSRVFSNAVGLFVCMFLMTQLSEEFVIPSLRNSRDELRAAGIEFITTGKGYNHFNVLLLTATVHIMVPFTALFLLCWLIIWEFALNAFAEISRFADRQFYVDWWNARDWLEFSRKWNLPVHHFLWRHVYQAALRNNLSRWAALNIAFFVSSALHELIMGCITHKLRGYALAAMVQQPFLWLIQSSRFVRPFQVALVCPPFFFFLAQVSNANVAWFR